jgi:hypothetical protein
MHISCASDSCIFLAPPTGCHCKQWAPPATLPLQPRIRRTTALRCFPVILGALLASARGVTSSSPPEMAPAPCWRSNTPRSPAMSACLLCLILCVLHAVCVWQCRAAIVRLRSCILRGASKPGACALPCPDPPQTCTRVGNGNCFSPAFATDLPRGLAQCIPVSLQSVCSSTSMTWLDGNSHTCHPIQLP